MFSLEEQEPNFVALRHFVFSEFSLFLSLSSELFPQERERERIERKRENDDGMKKCEPMDYIEDPFHVHETKNVLFSGSEESKFPFSSFLFIFLFLPIFSTRLFSFSRQKLTHKCLSLFFLVWNPYRRTMF